MKRFLNWWRRRDLIRRKPSMLDLGPQQDPRVAKIREFERRLREVEGNIRP